MKPVQYFSDEYLEQCRQMSPTRIARFLDDFRKVHAAPAPSSRSKLISMKVPEDLLNAFRQQCELEGVRYQTKIKQLMQDYLRNTRA